MSHDSPTLRPASTPLAPWFSAAAFGLIALLVTLYVALATGHRDEVGNADAWEHHRAVRVMALLGLGGPEAQAAGTSLLQPGNPTHLADEPSIRYSPYTVLLALGVRAGLVSDAYVALSVAAVANTIMLFAGLWAFLRALRAQHLAWLVAPFMLFFWGEAPGYANTLAFADLPWHQVNPSAFGLWLCLLAWALWAWAGHQPRRIALALPAAAVLLAVTLLSHGMTGVLGGIGLMAVAMGRPERPRVAPLALPLAACVLAGLLCTLWPAYSFVKAITLNPDRWYWYNPGIVQIMLGVWCLPGLLACLLALPLRDQPVVRVCFWALLGIGALTAFAIATRSPTFARLPLAGMLFAFILLASVAHHLRPWSLGAWLESIGGLWSRTPGAFGSALTRWVLAFLLAFFAAPQLFAALREPHLLRPYIAHAMGREAKAAHRLRTYRAVLQHVGERDVVYADQIVGWPVPSVAGRVVGAHHLDFFTPANRQRLEEGDELFHPATTTARRVELLRSWNARWILLDAGRNAQVMDVLAPAQAVAQTHGPLTLVDAHAWLRLHEAP